MSQFSRAVISNRHRIRNRRILKYVKAVYVSVIKLDVAARVI